MSKNKLRFLCFSVLLIFNFLFEGIALAQIITPPEFQHISYVAENLLKHYPASEFIFIGVGRSPSAVISYLELTHPGSAYHLPLSGFRPRPGELEKAGTLSNLFSHFDQFIPINYLNTGKKIVLLDYSSMGHTLISVDHYLEKYLKEKGLKNSIQLVAMANQQQAPYVLTQFHENKIKSGKVIIVQDGLSHDPSEKFSFKLRNQQYDRYSPYMQFSPHLKGENQILRKNPEHKKFKQELLKLIQKKKGNCDSGILSNAEKALNKLLKKIDNKT